MLPYFSIVQRRLAVRAWQAGAHVLLFMSWCVMAQLGSFGTANAQPVQPEIRIAVPEETPFVFVYHTALTPVGHGFNVYRRGLEDDEYEKLNDQPVRGVASGTELRALLGTLYDDIERTTGQTTDNGTLTKLRSDFKTANLLSFIYPEVAEALGRLYIDHEAPLEEPATYKIEFVDALDAPTGEILERTALLLPQKPDAPSYLRAENQGNLITLFWRYIPPGENTDDKVIRFEAFRIDPSTNQHQRLNDKVLLRNNALFEYSLTFEVPTTGQTEQLYVRSIDITGQASEPSAILRYDALDLDPPNLALDVEAKPISNQRVQISWKPSNAEAALKDVAGYNVYRSMELHDNASYRKLNHTPLSLNVSTYNDTLAASAGSQVFFYRLTAVDASGNEGPFSTAAMVLVEDRTPPRPPTGLQAVWAGDGKVSLAWGAGNLPADFQTFIVLRRRLGPYAPELPSRVNLAPLRETAFIDAGEAGRGFYEGATYRYTVLSSDAAGNFSDPAQIDIEIPDVSAPLAPNGVQAKIENASRIAVFWNPSASSDVMSYIVYRREAGSGRLVAQPVPHYTRRFEDERVIAGASYEYRVTAADSAGNESVQSQPFSILMRDFTPPRNVRNLRVLPRAENMASLQWEPVSALDMAGYNIYRSTSLTGVYEPLNAELITDTRWEDADSAPGLCYRVLAIDTSGNESKPGQPACLQAKARQ